MCPSRSVILSVVVDTLIESEFLEWCENVIEVFRLSLDLESCFILWGAESVKKSLLWKTLNNKNL